MERPPNRPLTVLELKLIDSLRNVLNDVNRYYDCACGGDECESLKIGEDLLNNIENYTKEYHNL